MQNWLEHNRLIIILALVGIVILGAGIFWLKTSSQPETKVEILSASTDNTEQILTKDIYIDISGAVNKPGIYKLKLGSRIEDALQMAGGIASDANSEWVETNLNRAAVLIDGQKIYIPNTLSTPLSTVKIISEKININSASKAELESLTGVGPVTAEKIISGRPYQTVEELVSKKIMGQKTFAKIKNQLSVW